jgi:hypothetical protein
MPEKIHTPTWLVAKPKRVSQYARDQKPSALRNRRYDRSVHTHGRNDDHLDDNHRRHSDRC